ncbi:hypothetical protein KUTeg_023810 [Tegillarca granosa]|uniref:STAS domain-containing protein n=1 Tax=Tegillarca granosa TaxID=220873 RepID=A0ABQ9E3N2_TEGGR|nr:hypothetical protein KUTeg_023810 [Tegillarca granosa]
METDKFQLKVDGDTDGFVPNSEKLDITRYFHDQVDTEQLYRKPDPPRKTIKERISSLCTGSDVLCYLISLFPIFGTIKSYQIKSYILGDVVSGISSACLHFPQGLAFGILASLSPAQGLYTSFFPVICYVIFGTSPHISFGTNAVIALFTAEIVEMQEFNHEYNSTVSYQGNFSLNLEHEALQLKSETAAGASFFVGAILLAMGFLRLGFITSYISSSFISAFTTASAVHIISSQVPKALGISVPLISGAGKLILLYIEIFKRIATANVASIIISLICIAILIIVKDCINEKCKDKMKMPVPIDLILIIVATLISHFGRLSQQFGVAIVNEIPSGIPAPSLPRLSVDYLGQSFITAIIVFVLTISMARVCEIKHDYQVNDNQELIAYGMANFVGSFFSCFPSCTAPPRTMLLSTLGAKTTLNGVFTTIFILLVLLVIGPLFTSLPQAVLAIMVIMAVKNLLLQVKQLKTYWSVNIFDFIIWLGTFLCGVLIDFPFALYIGVILCFFTVVLQSQTSKYYTLKKSTSEDLFLDSNRHQNVVDLQTIKIFRMESSLYFATADLFRNRLYAATVDPRKLKRTKEINVTFSDDKQVNSTDDPIIKNTESTNSPQSFDILKYVILDCSAINYIDSNGVQVLLRICGEFDRAKVQVLFANTTVCFQNIVQNSVLSDSISKEHIFPTTFDAVRYALNPP